MKSISGVVPLKVGIVGTGYAARKRAEAIIADPRGELLAVTGNTPERIAEFCQKFGVKDIASWTRLVNLPEIDLIFVCTINRDCGAIARAAILAGKQVVVEYPLALEAKLAQEIIHLAQTRQQLLHVEHMEIIGGLHQAVKEYLPQVGKVFHARYATVSAQASDRHSWKYHRETFGFPLAAALSRIHRLTDLFGEVAAVNCHNRYWDEEGHEEQNPPLGSTQGSSTDYFRGCWCDAQLTFKNGIRAELIYGKGDICHRSYRTLEIYGEAGMIVFEGEQGKLIQSGQEMAIPVTSRRGLFTKDTQMVLDYLFEQKPLYIQPEASLYALQVANAAQKSSSLEQKIYF